MKSQSPKRLRHTFGIIKCDENSQPSCLAPVTRCLKAQGKWEIQLILSPRGPPSIPTCECYSDLMGGGWFSDTLMIYSQRLCNGTLTAALPFLFAFPRPQWLTACPRLLSASIKAHLRSARTRPAPCPGWRPRPGSNSPWVRKLHPADGRVNLRAAANVSSTPESVTFPYHM